MNQNRQKWLFYLSLILSGFALAVLISLVSRNLGTSNGWLHGLFVTLQPFFVGIIMTYLLYPLAYQTEQLLLKKKASKRLARALSVITAALFLLCLFFLFGALILPELAKTISALAVSFQAMANDFTLQASLMLERWGFPASLITQLMDQISSSFYNWLKNDLNSAVNTLLSMVTGLFGVARIALNLFVGFIVMVYLLISRDQFIGQSKKTLYALCKNRDIAAKILKHFRRINAIFGGFLTGKVIDSLIIGVICFICLSILQLPYIVLISVVIGVTNIIPVFGPFIGAIPCAFLLLLTDPAQCLIFIIFIIILQQIDGNIIGPKILGDSTGLPAFWVLFSLLLFQYFLGFWGMIIGVPVFAAIYYLMRELVNYLLKKRDLPTATKEYVQVEKISQEGEFTYLSTEKRSSFRKQNISKKQESMEEDKKENPEEP